MKEYILRLRMVRLDGKQYTAAVFNGSRQLIQLDKAYPTETDAVTAVLEKLAVNISFGETTQGEPATAECLRLLADIEQNDGQK